MRWQELDYKQDLHNHRFRGDTLTLILGFCHKVCIFDSACQSNSLSTSSKLQLKCSLASIVRSSIQPRLRMSAPASSLIVSLTYLRPRQPLGPNEKGCEASSLSLSFLPSQRSGTNSQGSAKLAGSKEAATGFVDTTTWNEC